MWEGLSHFPVVQLKCAGYVRMSSCDRKIIKISMIMQAKCFCILQCKCAAKNNQAKEEFACQRCLLRLQGPGTIGLGCKLP